MLDGPFALAAAAGMAATLNPCGFALLPAYLAAFVATSDRHGAAAVPRALLVGASLTVGFVAVFGLFGVLVSPLAVSVERYLPWATILIGVALAGLGAYLLAGRELTVAVPKLQRGGRDGTVRSMFLFGVSYAVASLSCTIGPFLAVPSLSFAWATVVSGVAVFVVYALGMGAVVTTLTVGVALARAGLVGRLRSALPYVSRFSGGLLVVAGAYVAWYGWFEVRTLNGGDGRDPIVERATDLQGWLRRTLLPDDAVTALPVVLGALVAVGVLSWLWRRRGRPVGSGQDSDGGDERRRGFPEGVEVLDGSRPTPGTGPLVALPRIDRADPLEGPSRPAHGMLDRGRGFPTSSHDREES
jgi:cytochrome c-type biogenesis protein